MVLPKLKIGILGTLLGLGLAYRAFAADPSYDTYKSWLLVCDNGLTCEAKGFTHDDSGTPDLRFIRAAGPAGLIEVQLNAVEPFNLDSLRVDGHPLKLDARAWTLKSSPADGTSLSTKQPAAAMQLLSQLRSAQVLQAGDDKNAIVPLDGMVAALLRMDDRQGRVGGVTALIRKGAAPASQVPAAPSLPIVPRHKVTAHLSDKETVNLIDRFRKGCDDIPAGSADNSAYALDASTAIVLIACEAGAYQTAYDVHLVSRQPGHDELPLRLPGWVKGPHDAGVSLTEATFDPETGALNTFDKGRGLADCGEQEQWIWNGQAFVLSSDVRQTECGGSEAGDYPTVYRSR